MSGDIETVTRLQNLFVTFLLLPNSVEHTRLSSIDCEHRKSNMRAKEVRAIKARVKKAKAKSKHRVTSKIISGFIKQAKVETSDYILKNRNPSKEWE